MIIETIFSTLDVDGKPNFAPMGLALKGDAVAVRPYRNTRTFGNLSLTGCGVANVTDDVLAFVKSCFYDAVLPHFPAEKIHGAVFEHTCSWMELEVVSGSGDDVRADFDCRVVHTGRRKDYAGFCRAGGAVIEAAILATRIDMNDLETVEEELNRYQAIVEKTGSGSEEEAMRLIRQYIRRGSDD
jgi:hypothetical protein